MAQFRILSLDGGGSWALIQVMALQAIYSENTTGHNILKDFDLVAANSGGSITLGGLIENLSLKDLLSDYFLKQDKRMQIFSESRIGTGIEDFFYRMIGIAPKYSTADKLAALQKQFTRFGAVKLSAIPGRIAQSVGKCPHFMICAFDYDRMRATFFRSNLKSDAASTAPPPNPTLAEAVNASSTAPVKFFDAPAAIGPLRYWDGAIAGYNNPILGAVVEAVANGIAPKDINVLSIGTASVRRPIALTSGANNSGVMQNPQISNPGNDLKELTGSILDDPPDTATFVAHVMLGQPVPDSNHPSVEPGRAIVRLNPMIQPVQNQDGSWAPPPGLSVDEFNAVANLDAVAQADVQRIQNLCTLWMRNSVPNQPIRSNSENFHCEIGHATFSQAKAAWAELMKESEPIAAVG